MSKYYPSNPENIYIYIQKRIISIQNLNMEKKKKEKNENSVCILLLVDIYHDMVHKSNIFMFKINRSNFMKELLN